MASRKSILERFLFAERLNMEITEEELVDLVERVQNLNNQIEDEMCFLEDRKLQLHYMLAEIEEIYEGLTEVAKQAKPGPS